MSIILQFSIVNVVSSAEVRVLLSIGECRMITKRVIMRSLPLQLHTYRHENLIHIFISVLTCYSSYTSSSNIKLPRTVESTHFNDETQKITYFLIHSPHFLPSMTSHYTQQHYHTYFKHFLLPGLRKTSQSQITTGICPSLYHRLSSVLTVCLIALVVHGSDIRGSP
jgi:hypothetical protein